MSISRQIVSVLKDVIPEKCRPAQLHEPWFCGNESKYVKDCIDTGWVSSVGSYVDKFEEMLADFTGAKHAIVTVNGTAALSTCLKIISVGVGDEVIVPSLTFVATANAVSHCEAVPHFVDCERDSLGIDAKKLSDYLEQITEKTPSGLINKNTGRLIKAIIAVHIFGLSSDMEAIAKTADKFGLPLIEDAAEGLGSYYKGKHVGNFGVLSVLSFNGNKTITITIR